MDFEPLGQREFGLITDFSLQLSEIELILSDFDATLSLRTRLWANSERQLWLEIDPDAIIKSRKSDFSQIDQIIVSGFCYFLATFLAKLWLDIDFDAITKQDNQQY